MLICFKKTRNQEADDGNERKMRRFRGGREVKLAAPIW